MRKGITSLAAVVGVALIVFAVSAWSSAKADERVASVSLDQILERTQIAMGAVSSYRSAGTGSIEDSTGALTTFSREFSERQSDDRYRFELLTSVGNSEQLTEWTVVDNQMFYRLDGPDWFELNPAKEEQGSATLAAQFGEFVDKGGIELVSANEVTDDGVRVYRLQTLEEVDIPEEYADGSGIELKTLCTTYLVDRDTFRIVSRKYEYEYENIVFVETAGGLAAERKWSNSTETVDYYDYGATILVEAPAEYTLHVEPKTAEKPA